MAQDTSLVLQSSNRTTSSLSTLLAWMQPGPSQVENVNAHDSPAQEEPREAEKLRRTCIGMAENIELDGMVSDGRIPNVAEQSDNGTMDYQVYLSLVKPDPDSLVYVMEPINEIEFEYALEERVGASVPKANGRSLASADLSDGIPTFEESRSNSNEEVTFSFHAEHKSTEPVEEEKARNSTEYRPQPIKNYNRPRVKCERCSKHYLGLLSNHRKKCGAKHKCRDCGKGFGLRHLLVAHVKKMHAPDRHKMDGKVKGPRKLLKQICVRCGKEFPNSAPLLKHMRSCKPFKCGICKKNYNSLDTLESHEASIHRGEKPHVCDVCGKRFVWKASLLNHRETHEARLTLECDVCDKAFTKKNNLREHMRTHADDRKRDKCKICGRLLLRENLSEHEDRCKQKAQEEHVCDVCGRKFLAANSLTIHKRTCLLTKCSTCGDTFNSLLQLREHRNHVHGELHKCKICGKGFKVRQNCYYHERTHSEEPRICEICGKGIPRKPDSMYDLHLRQHREGPKCDICGKCFSFASNLSEHKRVIHSDGGLCGLCGKRFSSMVQCRKHEKLRTCISGAHTLSKLKTSPSQKKKKPTQYDCVVCGKSYESRADFLTHERSHGQEPVECKHCGRMMPAGLPYRRHVRRHEKSEQLRKEPQICEICGETLKTLDILRDHRRARHTDEGLCRICGKRFALVTTRKKHEKRMHGSQIERLNENI